MPAEEDEEENEGRQKKKRPKKDKNAPKGRASFALVHYVGWF